MSNRSSTRRRRKPLYLQAKKDAEVKIKVVVQAEQQALLQADKTLLKAGVTKLGLSGEVLEIVTKAIDAHKKSDDSYGLMIEKGFKESSILEACQKWGLITHERVNGDLISEKLKIISDVHSPGWDKPTIEWKKRGKFWEKTRNLIVFIVTARSQTYTPA